MPCRAGGEAAKYASAVRKSCGEGAPAAGVVNIAARLGVCGAGSRGCDFAEVTAFAVHTAGPTRGIGKQDGKQLFMTAST